MRHYPHGPGDNRRPVTAAKQWPKNKVTPFLGTLSKDGARGAVDQPYLCAMVTGLGVKITSHTLNSSDGLFVADAAADGADLTTSM